MRLLAADETEHCYNDKFMVAENLSTTVQQAVMTVLRDSLGLTTPEHQALFDKWVKNKDAITMRFVAKDSCTFLKETDVQVKEGSVKTEVKSTGGFLGGSTSSRESTHYRTVKEYHWKVRVVYTLSVYAGNDCDGGIVLKERTSDTILATQTKRNPLSAATVHPVMEAPLTWFGSKEFTINRDATDPITPRRNSEIKAALHAASRLSTFASTTRKFFQGRLQNAIMDKDQPVIPRTTTTSGVLAVGATATIEGLTKEPTFNGQKVRVMKFANNRYEVEPLDPNAGLPKSVALKASNLLPDQSPTTGPSLCAIEDDTVVVPILPVLEDEATTTGTTALSEHARTLRRAVLDLEKWYPNARLVKMITSQEAVMVLSMLHLETLLKRYSDAVDYLEATLRKQLVTAIGKQVDSSDFRAYMQYHYSRRLFGPNYRPTPLCRAVRRPGCFPDGTIALEQVVPLSSNTPVATWVRESPAATSFHVPIHAAASIELTGPKYLHGWMQHRFSGDAQPKFQLACRARQFSSFLVILGTLSGPDTMDPQHAIIVQNKDELLIPLMADPLPSAKEFKDAIQSLSPEQQEFAKEFRSMQLSTSVFGVVVVQLKPQLEKLLNLPDTTLTKEIQLTQDLMSLFVDHQIPSDMLTYDGAPDAPAADKVSSVKEYTKSVLNVIDESKKKQLKEEEMRADMRYEQQHIDADEGNVEECYTSIDGLESGVVRKALTRTKRMAVKTMPKMQLASSLRYDGVAEQSMPGGFGAPAQPPGHSSSGFGSPQAGGPPSDQSSPFSLEYDDTTKEQPDSPDRSPMFATGQNPAGGSNVEDFTIIPKILDGKLERLDTSGALRSTIVKAGPQWTRSRQDNLLTDAKTSALGKDEIENEKKKAFDLLDAISRSGTLPIACSELHVFVAVSHCFENDVMGTVIEDNVNPIAKVERSALLLASTTFGVATSDLIANERDVERLTSTFPQLFIADGETLSV